MADRREQVRQSSIIRPDTPSLFDLTNKMVEGDEPETVYVEVEKIVEVAPENALVPMEDGGYVYRDSIALTRTGMLLAGDIEEGEWEDVGRVIKSLESSAAWIAGDWALYANQRWGMTGKQIAEKFGYEQATIETYMSVCRSIPGMIRNHTVSFSHHRLVQGLPYDRQDYWIKQAAQHGWKLSQMREAINGKRITPPRLVSKEIADDWNYLRTLEEGERDQNELQQAQYRINKMRQALDDLERKLWGK